MGHKKGTLVYILTGTDYGSSSMDSFITQIQHISVTTNEEGDYPFFTVPLHDLEEV
jgi:hypothetical protein